MPVCITGMGRSGTSLVAQALQECGLFLGQPEDLLPENASNREGHWEHAGIVALNDELLSRFGGAWNAPPELPHTWERQSNVTDLADRAREIVDQLARHAPWGWKDPRAALTLRFWLWIIGEFDLVICVRHPAEVAQSLASRDGMPTAQALELWLAYYDALEAELAERQIVTRYDRFFTAPLAELDRLTTALGLTPTSKQVARAVARVNTQLRHHVGESPAEPWPDDARARWEDLCRRAGDPAPRDLPPLDPSVELAATRELLGETRERLYLLQDELVKSL